MKKRSILACALTGALLLSGCTAQTQPSAQPSESQSAGIYTPGDYTATAKGYGGDVTVTMTFDANSITDVAIVGDSETSGIGSNAVEQMPQQILDAQSAEVDGVSGATFTSTAVRTAAADCIDCIACAIWLSGWVNKRIYIINATITPNSMRPRMTSVAPTTQTAT